MKRELIVMAKAPLPGFAKSRLVDPPEASGLPVVGRLDPAHVARLADAFLRDTLRVCERCVCEARSIVFAPPESEAYFRALARAARLMPQGAGDLGAGGGGAGGGGRDGRAPPASS